METRDILVNGQVAGQISLPEGTPEAVWQEKMAAYQPRTMSPVEIVAAKMAEAKEFGSKLMDQFVIENVLLGIEQMQKTEAVQNFLQSLLNYCLTGSLRAGEREFAILESQMPQANLEPFVTFTRLRTYRNAVRAYLGMPPVA